MKKEVRIECDGTAIGTNIFFGGEKVNNATELNIHMTASGLAECTMTLIKVPFNFKGIMKIRKVKK